MVPAQVFAKCGLSLRQAARAVGLSPGHLSELLNGKRGKRPRAKTLKAMHELAAICGVSFRRLWGKSK